MKDRNGGRMQGPKDEITKGSKVQRAEVRKAKTTKGWRKKNIKGQNVKRTIRQKFE